MEPVLDLPRRYAVALRCIPYQLRIKGRGERSVASEWKVRYSYMDARRWANRRGGFPIRGPRKVYDSTPALVGALFAQELGIFREYSLEAFARFFDHRLEIDRPEAVAALFDELAGAGAGGRYEAFRTGPGAAAFEACVEEGLADHVFGVPYLIFRGEAFWGHDRLPLLEERLEAAGLRRDPSRP